MTAILTTAKEITNTRKIYNSKVALFKPFISVLLIVTTMLSLVFLQMEERRLGYVILKLEKEQRVLLNQKRMKEVTLAKLTRPQHVESLALKHLTLKRAQPHQVIHMSPSPSRLPAVIAQQGY